MSDTINEYDLGDLVRCSNSDIPPFNGTPFTNVAGTVIDPAAVFFQVKNPSGVVTAYTYGTDVELVKVSTGIYYVDVDANMSGTWWYRLYSTGSGQAADERSFTVAASEF